jgi:hypothetical protein
MWSTMVFYNGRSRAIRNGDRHDCRFSPLLNHISSNTTELKAHDSEGRNLNSWSFSDVFEGHWLWFFYYSEIKTPKQYRIFSTIVCLRAQTHVCHAHNVAVPEKIYKHGSFAPFEFWVVDVVPYSMVCRS